MLQPVSEQNGLLIFQVASICRTFIQLYVHSPLDPVWGYNGVWWKT